jgi:hypothetical protein
MRLVSLWWELPPRLDSKFSIWNLELQEESVFSFVNLRLEEPNRMIPIEIEAPHDVVLQLGSSEQVTREYETLSI